jgi:hypothetical protein
MIDIDTLKAPFPWAGGKSKVAHIVWPRFGDTLNYVEPFAGSLAILLARPYQPRTETVNDADCYLANFWRATQADPEAVACYADWPVNEIDLHARHRWLVSQAEFRERMIADPEYYDAKVAGWWVWGLSCWIGSGWCDVSKTNPVQVPYLSGTALAQGINTRNGSPRPNLRPAQGVNGLSQQVSELQSGRGVHRAHEKRPQLSRPGRGVPGGNDHAGYDDIYSYIAALRDRLRRVRVCCGDWSRIMGPSPTYKIGMTAVFLDPPYSGEMRDKNIYSVDSHTVAEDVRAWCIEEIRDDFTGWHGRRFEHPNLRIALCGYDGEHNELSEVYGWDMVAWKANGGYGNQRKNGTNDNGGLERIWFSPNCIPTAPKHQQMSFF